MAPRSMEVLVHPADGADAGAAPSPIQSPSDAAWTKLLSGQPADVIKAVLASKLSINDVSCLDSILIDSYLRELSLPLDARASIVAKLRGLKSRLSPASADTSAAMETATATDLVLNKVDAADSLEPADRYSFLASIPGVNLMYELLFDDVPTVTDVKETLNLLGIMGALVFTVVASIPLTHDYDAYAAMLERWSDGNLYGDCWVSGFLELEYFNRMVSISIGCSFITIILTLLTYIFLVNARFASDTELAIWWNWNKWVVLLTFLTLITACATAFASLQNHSEWNMPNRRVIESNGYCPVRLLRETTNPWGFNVQFTTSVCVVTLVLSTAIISLSIRARMAERKEANKRRFRT